MSAKYYVIIFVALIVLVFLGTSVYTVKEGELAIVLRLGQIETNAQGQAKIKHPGLHFKWPGLEQVTKFDIRLKTLDVQSSRLLTAEQKYLLVDYYVKWRIANLPDYLTRTNGSVLIAEQLLQQKINDVLRAQFGIHTVQDVISDDREKVMSVLRRQAAVDAQSLGIQIVDVRIKRIDLPEEVSQSVFARMQADREKVAAEHRSSGKGKAEAIRAQADAQATVLVAEASTAAAKIKAKGDKEAAAIYAKAYTKDPGFYRFYRSLLAYQKIFSQGESIFVLSPKGDLFKYFNQMTEEK